MHRLFLLAALCCFTPVTSLNTCKAEDLIPRRFSAGYWWTIELYGSLYKTDGWCDYVENELREAIHVDMFRCDINQRTDKPVTLVFRTEKFYGKAEIIAGFSSMTNGGVDLADCEAPAPQYPKNKDGKPWMVTATNPSEEEICAFCQQNPESDASWEVWADLKDCKHRFHAHCVYAWVTEAGAGSNSCMNCRVRPIQNPVEDDATTEAN